MRSSTALPILVGRLSFCPGCTPLRNPPRLHRQKCTLKPGAVWFPDEVRVTGVDPAEMESGRWLEVLYE